MANRNVASNKSGVVGKTGTKIPTTPVIRASQPRQNNAARFSFMAGSLSNPIQIANKIREFFYLGQLHLGVSGD